MRWLAVAAGIEGDEARRYFQGNKQRADRATTPLRTFNGAEVRLLFVIRPLNPVPNQKGIPFGVTHFAPGESVPTVELHHAYLRIWNIPSNGIGLHNLRWEFDVASSLRTPIEDWLPKSASLMGFNPAHSLILSLASWLRTLRTR